jgi:hypothetical protein
LVGLHSKDGYAGGFDKFDFSLRFPAALSRFSPYADVAGVGGASAASKWQSSTNPAGMAWEPMPAGARFTASPQFSTVGFDAGTRLNVPTESLSIDGGDAGRFLLSAAQAWSNKSTDRSGLGYGFDLGLGQLAWGKRFSPQWSAGLALTYDRSHTDFSMGSIGVSHTRDETYSAKLGVHYRASKKLHLGLVFEQGVAPSTTDYYDVLGMGTGTVRLHDTTWQTTVRPGIAYEYAPQSTIYADYQFARFSNDTGTLIVNRVFAGVEQRISEGIFLRGGFNADARGNIGWTAGVGFYPTPTMSLDVGFQDNNFPELEPDFGRSRTFTLSASVSF